jgi:hypothetical protein
MLLLVEADGNQEGILSGELPEEEVLFYILIFNDIFSGENWYNNLW